MPYPKNMIDERHTAPHYQIYVLRIWQEDSTTWRAMLQETQSGERRGFTDMEALLKHIRQALGESPTPPPTKFEG
jgi:hypothetical protein